MPVAYYRRKMESSCRRPRRHVETPKLRISPEQFQRWVDENPPVCCYCGTHENDIEALGIIDQNGNHVKTIGIDRLVGPDYAIGNIGWACILCNKVKSSSNYSYDEMLREVGPVLGRVHRRRIREVRARERSARRRRTKS